MGTLYIRNVDEEIIAILNKKAKENGISTSKLVRNILEEYATKPIINNLENKYQSFVNEFMGIYVENLDKVNRSLNRNNEISERLEKLLSNLENGYFE